MNEYNYSEVSKNYDNEVAEYNSYIHEVIFGMCYDFVNSGEKLLDLGIGTGLGSQKFSSLGIDIFGIDTSESMLKVCEAKAFAKDLRIHDLNDNLPFYRHQFNHVISSGLFHFLGDLSIIFSEVSRVLRKDGIFAFSYVPNKNGNKYSQEMTKWDVDLFRHNPNYIENILTNNSFIILKEQRLLTKGWEKKLFNMEFSVIIAQHK